MFHLCTSRSDCNTGTFGDHSTRNANRHLQTKCHKDVVSSKLTFDISVNDKQMFGNYCEKQLCLKKFL